MQDALGRVHEPHAGAARIVSLVPSLTELVCDLDLAEYLVGRTGFCIHPRSILKSVPKVGGTKDVKVDRVRALRPTHLIANIDENRRETVEALSSFVPHVIVTHPLKPDDNLGLYELFGHIFNREPEARRLAREFDAASSALAAAVSALPRENVLYLIWRRPWMTLSRTTYISATLARAGWDTLPSGSDERYPEIDGTETWLREVDRVLLPSEPYRFRGRHVEEVRGLVPLPETAIGLIDGEMTSWYGSRASAGLRYLARLRTLGLASEA